MSRPTDPSADKTVPDPAASRLVARWLQLWTTLRAWPWLATLRTLRQRFREDRLGLTASSLTFTTTIALVPLATVMFALFTAFPMFGRFRSMVEGYFIDNLVPDAIAKPVLLQMTMFATKAHRAGTVGMVVLGVTAIALLLTIDRTLNGIWRVRQPRGLAQRVLVYWAIVTLGPLVLGVSLSMTSYVLSASKGLVGALPGGLSLALNMIELIMMAVAMAGLFRYVPNTPVRWEHAMAGGVFVALGFEGAQRLLAWYLGINGTYTTIYGAFAAVPILLVWIYLGWVIVLLGAVIAAYAPSLQMQVVRHPGGPGWRFSLALKVLRELDLARRGGVHARHGVALLDLARTLRLDPLQIEPLLDDLVDMDWVGRLDEETSPRHVLLVEPSDTSAEPLVRRWLLAPEPAVETAWGMAGFQDWRLDGLLRGLDPGPQGGPGASGNGAEGTPEGRSA